MGHFSDVTVWLYEKFVRQVLGLFPDTQACEANTARTTCASCLHAVVGVGDGGPCTGCTSGFDCATPGLVLALYVGSVARIAAGAQFKDTGTVTQLLLDVRETSTLGDEEGALYTMCDLIFQGLDAKAIHAKMVEASKEAAGSAADVLSTLMGDSSSLLRKLAQKLSFRKPIRDLKAYQLEVARGALAERESRGRLRLPRTSKDDICTICTLAWNDFSGCGVLYEGVNDTLPWYAPYFSLVSCACLPSVLTPVYHARRKHFFQCSCADSACTTCVYKQASGSAKAKYSSGKKKKRKLERHRTCGVHWACVEDPAKVNEACIAEGPGSSGWACCKAKPLLSLEDFKPAGAGPTGEGDSSGEDSESSSDTSDGD